MGLAPGGLGTSGTPLHSVPAVSAATHSPTWLTPLACCFCQRPGRVASGTDLLKPESPQQPVTRMKTSRVLQKWRVGRVAQLEVGSLPAQGPAVFPAVTAPRPCVLQAKRNQLR